MPFLPASRGLRYWTFFIGIFTLWGLTFYSLFQSFLIKPGLLALLGLTVLLAIGLAIWNAYRATSPTRLPILGNPLGEFDMAYEDVTFNSRDGLLLSGWYIPSQNGSAVILTHGIGSNRRDLVHVALFLGQCGFGVLLYDLRAHGRSQGGLSTWGWQEVSDLLGAFDYLNTRPEIHTHNIGIYGFSLGGQISLRAAAHERAIRAVVSDGTAPAVLADHAWPDGFTIRRIFLHPWLWLVYWLQSLLTGVPAPPGVFETISQISSRPVLLISSGNGTEQANSHRYFQAAGEPKELWNIPEARHGGTFDARPREYAGKVCAFFERWLVGEIGLGRYENPL
jgi:pimeloyl-ACP methyl ester carboxylesterase